MPPKKLNDNEGQTSANWIQITTLLVSILGICVWIFSIYFTGWISKSNEIETRLYQQKYEIYKSFVTEIHKLINFPWNTMSQWTIDRYKRNIQNLEDFILEKWPWIRILWWNSVNKYFNCLSSNIDWFKNEVIGKIINFNKDTSTSTRKLFEEEIILWLWFLENSMRQELWRDLLPDLYYSSWWKMSSKYKEFNTKCENTWNRIQTSNYFSWYLYNLK